MFQVAITFFCKLQDGISAFGLKNAKAFYRGYQSIHPLSEEQLKQTSIVNREDSILADILPFIFSVKPFAMESPKPVEEWVRAESAL